MKKVYCKNCKYFKNPLWITGEHDESLFKCFHPKNMENTYLEPKSKLNKHPSEINTFNNCENYKKKWWRIGG